MAEHLDIGRSVHQGLLTEVHAARIGNRPCVVKLPLRSRQRAATPRMEDEIQILARLQAPNIVRALGCVDWQGRQGLVLEWAGQGLEALMQGQPGLPPEVLAAVAVQLAEALEACADATTADGHDLELVHRDLAPQNVYVQDDGRVLLADFGNAWYRGRASQTQVGQAFGTEGFMAPEQRAGHLPTRRVDLYSLGCLLAWLHRPKAQTPSIEPTWQGPVAQWARAALQSSPVDRPPDARGLQAAGRQVMGTKEPQQVLRAWRKGLDLTVSDFRLGEVQVSLPMSDLPRPPPASPSSLDMFLGQGPPAGPRTQVVAPRPQEPLAFEPTQVDGPDAQRTTLSEPGELSAVPTRVHPSSLSAPAGLPPEAAVGSEPNVGSELYGYRLEAVLGQGQWGRVFLGRHTILGQEVAVKVLQGALAGHDRALQRFFREAQVLTQIDHPNVVRVQTCGHAPDGTPFLVMERVAGPSLKAMMPADRPMPAAEVAPLMREIALGLIAAHESGLVHRDLKPANILLTQSPISPRLKIADFGAAHLSNADNPITRTHELIGTPAYMAPEQILRSREVDARADLYSLGALTYRLLTGHNIFPGPALETMRAHLKSPPPPIQPSGFLDELVMALLQKDPEDRPQSAAEVVGRIDALLRTPEDTRMVPRPGAGPGRAARRWGWAAAATATAAAAGLVAYFATHAPAAQGRATPPSAAVAEPRPVPAPGVNQAPAVSGLAPAVPPRPDAPDPAPPSHRRPRPAQNRAPAHQPAPSMQQVARDLGLPLLDLARLAPQAMTDYRRATTEATRAQALLALERAAEDGPKLKEHLRTRLREVKQVLGGAVADLGALELEGLESKYLDIQERAVATEDAAACARLLRELRTLQSKLRAPE